MLPINGVPMIQRQIERIKLAEGVDELIVATSIDKSDDPLVEFLRLQGVRVFRGSLNDVLSRFLEIESAENPTAVIRLTGDCPLVMPELIDLMVAQFYEKKVDYLSNTLEPTFPDGLDIEIIGAAAIRKLASLDLSSAEHEHVTLGIYTRPLEFTLDNYRNKENLSQNRWTVDYLEDLLFVRQVFNAFKGREATFTFEETMLFLDANPDLRSVISTDRSNEVLDRTGIGDNAK
jgi:spore coat polysaccharide biosynthesis protein SpsF